MTAGSATSEAPGIRPAPRRVPLAWLGLLPFLLFSAGFLLLPIAFLVIGSFQTSTGEPTLENYSGLGDPYIVAAFWNSVTVSLISAVGGGIGGFLLAAAVVRGGLPRPLRTGLLTFSGVASNFAGVPLALAFVFTIGNNGLITLILKDVFGVSLKATGFTIYSQLGIALVYLYFQLPLMLLIVAPAIEGLRREWREAAENMGATGRQYWRHIAFPILLPTLLGTTILLFGNAFGAQATAFQLTGGTIPLVPVVIGAQIRGDVLRNQGLGYAMAMGMVLVMGVMILVYVWLRRRSERWLRS